MGRYRGIVKQCSGVSRTPQHLPENGLDGLPNFPKKGLKSSEKRGVLVYSKLEIKGLRLLLFSQGVGQGRVNSIPTGPILKLSLHHIKGQTVKSHP